MKREHFPKREPMLKRHLIAAPNRFFASQTKSRIESNRDISVTLNYKPSLSTSTQESPSLQQRQQNSLSDMRKLDGKRKFNEIVEGWKRDCTLYRLIAERNLEDTRSILRGMDYYDSFTLAACLRGLLVGERTSLNGTDYIDMLDELIDTSSVSIELHELLIALHSVGLKEEVQSLWNTWRWKYVPDENASPRNKKEEERKFILICNAFADWFAERGDLASVVYITRKVFQLGVHGQSAQLFLSQVKASGNALGHFSPKMSLKQMSDKGYPIDNGQTMAMFMRSMSDSRRWHAVYAIYKQSIEHGVAPTIEMVECMGENLIKECILKNINANASFRGSTLSCFVPFLDDMIAVYSHSVKQRWIKQPVEKYYLSMSKFIFHQLTLYKLEKTPRILAIQLMYGLITSRPQYFYTVLSIASRDDLELNRKDGPDWKLVWIILYKWSLSHTLPMINPEHIEDLASQRGLF